MRVSLSLLIVALQMAACGGTSTAPTPPPVVVPPVVVVPPPVVAAVIQVTPCPTSGPPDVAFYQQIGCNAFDLPMQSVRRWTIAPSVYLKTVDEAGVPIDSVTLDTVQAAMIGVAPAWTGSRFGLAGVERGTGSREGQSGWITVKWPTISDPLASCGRSQVAVDGGWIELNYKVGGGCSCGSSATRPLTARHELGHALGYWHTDNAGDLMTGAPVRGCDQQPSARELQAAAYQYR